jgi:hypothetical protein
MRPVGFSTGALAKGDFRGALRMLRGKGCFAVELSALREPELDPLVKAASTLDLSEFGYVSVHAPSRILGDETAIVVKLGTLAALGWPIVVHPDVIHDFGAWKLLGPRLVIENMDMRKPTGRDRFELERFFNRFPDARFCLDVGHARQVDPTMSAAATMIHAFGDRLLQLHVSEVNTRSRHESLSLATVIAFNKISHLIPDEVPLILETPVCEAEIDAQVQVARRALPHRDQPISVAL